MITARTRWQRGECSSQPTINVSIQRLEKIAEALELPLSELFSFGESPAQRKTHDLLILRLEDEVRFLRSQLNEKINYISNQNSTRPQFSNLDPARISRL